MKMNPIEMQISWWPFPIVAITLWPFIFFRGKAHNDPCIIAHEYYHFDEITRWGKRSFGIGIIVWYVLYLILWLKLKVTVKTSGARYRVDEHPMEKMAYEIQRRCIDKERSNGN